jgi:predicted MPP superfamily phosphohydrolase
MPKAYYSSVLERISEYKPDLIFIAGDFISRKKHVHKIPHVLRGISARLGVFAVLGNHDYWTNAELVSRYLEETGIILLSNRSERIRLNDTACIVLSGCEEPWSPGKWKAPDNRLDEPLLVISHTADNIYKLSNAGVTAVFTGHYHGGQAVIPGYGSIVIPSKYGRRFDHGHFLVKNTHLFVTSGVGAAVPPVRIYCKPEIMLVDFMGRQNL